MSNVYLTFKRSVGVILLFFSHTLLAQPVINSFSPTAGPVGTTVTITGTGFNTWADSNIVYFGAVRATLQSVSTTSLTVTVPAGATYAPITVTSNRLTAYSRLAFTVTFSYGHTPFDSTSFTRQSDLSGLGNPRNIAIADLNRDGRPDLMVTNQSSNAVSIYRNNGIAGGPVQLVLHRNISRGPNPFGIATGDLNGDGRLDAAVTNFGSNTVTVFTNTSVNDTIRFDTTTYVCGSNSIGVAIADVDGDGKPDLVTTSSNSGFISVFRNTTTAFAVTFAAKADFSTFDRADEVAIGDLDNDGKPDVVTANFLGTISVWKNLSTPGSISLSKTNYTAGSYPGDIAIADLNGDGKPDIVFSHYGSPFLSVYRNTSTTGSISLDVRKDFTTGTQSRGISIGDLNGDGKADVAVVSDSVYMLTLLQNASAGDSILLNNRYNFSLGAGPTGVAIGDLNNDGKPDITATNSYSKVSIFRNTQTGPVPVITSFTPTSAHKGTGVTIFGSHFTGATAVRFGGVAADSIVFVTDTAIRAIVDTGATGNVSVTTPFGTATKPGFTFIRDTIPDTTAAPVITSFTPTSGRKGTFVNIFGAHFTGATTVSFGSIPADSITFKNDTLIIAIVDTGATGNVSVTTPFGTATKPGFTFIRDTIPDTTAAPVITSFTPTSGRKGTFVNIFGAHFTGATTVSFGSIPADSITFKNDTLIIAIVDTGATGNVSVTTPFGTASKPGFTFIRDTIPDTTAAPVITSFSPTSGRKGTKVFILGSKFTNANAVSFGGIPADSITFKNDTLIIAIVDTGATGNVSVTTPFGTATKPGFTFIRDTIPDTTAAPVITSFTPTSGRKGTFVNIFGAHFTGATTVSFGSIPADSITFKNDTLIIAIVDTGATGSVSVTTPFGTATKPGFTFIRDTTSIPDTTTIPVITSFTPTFGQQGTVVTIFGKHLTAVNQVQFGGIPADSIWHYSDTVIKARVDTGHSGAVCVFAPTGSACKPGFTFIGDSTITDTLFVNTRTGINSNTTLTTAKSFRMYPNPASQYVVWQQPATGHRTSLQLIDISGRIVSNMVVASNATQTTIQVGGLHAGVYKLVWRDGNRNLTHTLLIQ